MIYCASREKGNMPYQITYLELKQENKFTQKNFLLFVNILILLEKHLQNWSPNPYNVWSAKIPKIIYPPLIQKVRKNHPPFCKGDEAMKPVTWAYQS